MPRKVYADAMSHGDRRKTMTVLGPVQEASKKPRSKDKQGKSLAWMKPLEGATRNARAGFAPEDAQRYTEQTGATLPDLYFEEMDTSLGRGYWWPIIDKLYQEVYRSDWPINMWLLDINRLYLRNRPNPGEAVPLAVTDLASTMCANVWPEQAKGEKLWQFGGKHDIVGDGTVQEDAMRRRCQCSPAGAARGRFPRRPC